MADFGNSGSLFHYIRVLLGNRGTEQIRRALALVTILLTYFQLYLVLNAYVSLLIFYFINYKNIGYCFNVIASCIYYGQNLFPAFGHFYFYYASD